MIEKPSTELLLTYKNFLGLSQDEVTAYARPKEESTFLSIAENVDIDRKYKLRRRDGRTLRLVGDYQIWSNGKRCLAVIGASLVEISKTFEISTLLSGIGDNHMSFVDSGGAGIFFTNNTIIGKVLTKAELLTGSGLNFKNVLPYGQTIGYYNGSVLVGNRNVIYISDVRNKNVYDNRTGFKQLEYSVIAFGSVGDGVYVSDEKQIFFADGPTFHNSKRQDILGVPMIPGTIKTLYDLTTPKGVYFKKAISWACSEGIFVGGDSGNIENVTRGKIEIGSKYTGTSVYRETGSLRQVINILK